MSEFQSDRLLAALQREIGAAATATARVPERIRLNPGAPADTMVALPIPPKGEIEELRAQLGYHPAYEVLIHPAMWDELVRDHLVLIESNMRRRGASDDEIAVMKANAYANPQDFRVFGIPVVDDTPKVLG